MFTGKSVFLIFLGAIIAYFIGSFNTAIILSKSMSGDDIREMGSGNAGMTNMMRNYGKKAGVITLICDMIKGILCVTVVTLLLRAFGEENYSVIMVGQYVAALFAVIGHIFPIYYGFKGGKGIAVIVGAILLVDFRVALTCLAVFLILVYFTKMVSVGSICAIAMFPVTTLIYQTFLTKMEAGLYNMFIALLVAVIIIYKHHENITRILNGTENKIGSNKE